VTEVAFHFGAPSKLDYTCRLLRKAVASGSRVLVIVGPHELPVLDVSLWGVAPTDFVAHCVQGTEGFVLQNSPVLLASSMANTLEWKQVLVNLTDVVPEGFDRFERVIEVVSTDSDDRDLARIRWKHYSALGYQIKRHDLNLRGAN
jgi:DNA polymerase-3 subunit chi